MTGNWYENTLTVYIDHLRVLFPGVSYPHCKLCVDPPALGLRPHSLMFHNGIELFEEHMTHLVSLEAYGSIYILKTVSS